MINPWSRIRELERELEVANLARVKAEDDVRVAHAALVVARESESKALNLVIAKSERLEDWMATHLMGRAPIHGAAFEKPKPPAPVRRPVSHGAALEAQETAAAIELLEKELKIDAVN